MALPSRSIRPVVNSEMFMRPIAYSLGLIAMIGLPVHALNSPPPSVKVDIGEAEPFCASGAPAEWRDARLDEANNVIDRQHRTAKGKAVVTQLSHARS